MRADTAEVRELQTAGPHSLSTEITTLLYSNAFVKILEGLLYLWLKICL
jgi:hypothetical protein